MITGYAGKVLMVDLTHQRTSLYPWTDHDRKLYLGGKVMAARILYDILPKDVAALSDDNIVVVSTGPFTNTGAPASSRFNVSSISPLTNLVTSSNCGGSFGLMLKKAGYDALIITGKSEERLHLEILEENVIFHNADDLWGLNVEVTQEHLPKRHGKLVIGPAGENGVLFAGLFSQERTAGRGGIGAVFGYKNIKAISCFGNQRMVIDDQTKAFYKKWIHQLRKHPLTGKQLPTYGTAGLVTMMQHRKILATKNFSKGQFEYFEDISGETLREKHLVKNKGCVTCPIQCGRQVKVYDKVVKGPELETLGLFGANIMNHDLEKINEWNYLLDLYGMDSISTAGVVAFAMELNEKGLWDNGLCFGKTDNIAEVLEDIAYKRGIGEDLANGVHYLSKKYGGEDFAIHSKGMELSAYEPRGAIGQGLGYAVSNRGGCHLNAGYIILFEGLSMAMNPTSTVNKAEFTIFSQDMMEACSAAGLCVFTLQAMLPSFVLKRPNHMVTRIANKALTTGLIAWFMKRLNFLKPHHLKIHLSMIPHTKALKLLTGIPMDLGQFKSIGERGFNLERLINISRGLKASDDDLPNRLKNEPQHGNENRKVPLDALKKQFYKCRGWSEKGVPSDKTLRKLGMIHGRS